MNTKIKNYVDVLFGDVPRSKRARELKEEMLSNLSERFEDYIAQGHSENQAYTMAVSNMGNIDELLEEVMPDEQFKSQANYYRKRNGRNTAIGVSMYILGAAVLIGFAGLGDFLGKEDAFSIVGLLILLVFAAIATGLIVYTNMSTPIEYKDFDEEKEKERRLYSGQRGRLNKSIMSIYWLIITCIYLGVSFSTMAWGITWIIWVFAGIFSEIIEVIMELRGIHE